MAIPLPIERIKLFFKRNRLTCLTSPIKNVTQSLSLQCDRGHKFNAAYNYLVQRRRGPCLQCKRLYNQNQFLERYKKYALNKNGVLISKKYLGPKTRLDFICHKGHVFSLIPSNIQSRGDWCPKCSGKFHPKTDAEKNEFLRRLVKIAAQKGGQLITKEFKGSIFRYIWKCSNNHLFKARYPDIESRLDWCPECSSSIFERICRIYCETIFQNKFPSKWPHWLRVGKTKMQLDGYCEELNVAFEYRGQYHYMIDVYSESIYKLSKIQERDRKKENLCRRHGVKLIVIPYFVKLEYLEEYILRKCKNLGLRVSNSLHTFDLSDLYNHSWLSEARKIAEERGGKCISKLYINARTRLSWECSNGHKWSSSLDNVKNKRSWCKKCKKI